MRPGLPSSNPQKTKKTPISVHFHAFFPFFTPFSVHSVHFPPFSRAAGCSQAPQRPKTSRFCFCFRCAAATLASVSVSVRPCSSVWLFPPRSPFHLPLSTRHHSLPPPFDRFSVAGLDEAGPSIPQPPKKTKKRPFLSVFHAFCPFFTPFSVHSAPFPTVFESCRLFPGASAPKNVSFLLLFPLRSSVPSVRVRQCSSVWLFPPRSPFHLPLSTRHHSLPPPFDRFSVAGLDEAGHSIPQPPKNQKNTLFLRLFPPISPHFPPFSRAASCSQAPQRPKTSRFCFCFRCAAASLASVSVSVRPCSSVCLFPPRSRAPPRL